MRTRIVAAFLETDAYEDLESQTQQPAKDAALSMWYILLF